jgi:tRNA A37 methylthiotransferase MiaB
MGKWIPLPVEFKGIWYNSAYGGWDAILRERFDPNLPPERVNRFLSNPKWVSKEEFEKRYGKVEMVIVDDDRWNSSNYGTPSEKEMVIFTEKYAIVLTEYDGLESFIAVPRDYRKVLGEETGATVLDG